MEIKVLRKVLFSLLFLIKSWSLQKAKTILRIQPGPLKLLSVHYHADITNMHWKVQRAVQGTPKTWINS